MPIFRAAQVPPLHILLSLTHFLERSHPPELLRRMSYMRWSLLLTSEGPADDVEAAVASCPFCGNDGFDFIAPFVDLDYLCIQCRKCSARGPLAMTGAEAMRRWNERGGCGH